MLHKTRTRKRRTFREESWWRTVWGIEGTRRKRKEPSGGNAEWCLWRDVWGAKRWLKQWRWHYYTGGIEKYEGRLKRMLISEEKNIWILNQTRNIFFFLQRYFSSLCAFGQSCLFNLNDVTQVFPILCFHPLCCVFSKGGGDVKKWLEGS